MISLLSRSNARAGPEESANNMQPSADLTDAEEGTSLPQEPAVVVDVADIGLHSRLASECRNNICCRLYSKFTLIKADRLRSRVCGRARGEKTLPKAQRTQGLSSYHKITVHSSQNLNMLQFQNHD